MNIRIHTEQVRNVGQQLRATSDQLSELTRYLRGAINSLDTWAWDGRSRADAEPMLDQIRPQGGDLARDLDHLGKMLKVVADRFEGADHNVAGGVEGLPWVDWSAAKPGMVLGAIYVAEPPKTGGDVKSWDAMTWAERYVYTQELKNAIAAIKAKIAELKEAIQRNKEALARLNDKIAELQAQKQALLDEAGKLKNKFLRPKDKDDRGGGFDDGWFDAPWRTRSDVFEDQIAELDRKISELEHLKDQLRIDQEAELTGLSTQLKTLQDRLREHVSRMSGKQDVGYSKNASTNDCVTYVKGQRPVPSGIGDWQNGKVNDDWNYGPAPQPGSIMVEGYDSTIPIGAVINGKTWGHVSYVDWVEYNDQGEVIRFHVVEGNWGGGKFHEQTFDWPIGDSSKRHPHRFICDEKS